MAFLDATIVTIAIPDIARSFPDAGIDSLSWVLNAYNIVFAAFLVAAGRAADLLGRKRMSELGLLVFTTASAACALAPSVELLVAARIAQAIGAAIIVPASLALVMHTFPAGERTHAVALWAANAALAAGLGPAVGGVLVDVAGWRAAFLVNIPIGVAAIVLARRTLVESRAPGKRTLPDLGGAVLLAGAVGALVLGVVKGPDWGWDDPRVIGAGLVSAALAILFVRRSARHPAPLLDGALLRIRSLSVANGLMVLAAAAYFGVILNNVLFLTTVWGWSVLEAGLAMTPGPIVAAVVAGPVGRLLARIDARPVILVGGAVWAAGIAGYLLLAGSEPDFFGGWLPATIVAGIGAGISFPTISGVAVAAAPGERFATATAITGVARQIGAAIGVAVLIAVIGTPATSLADFQRGWVLAIGIFLGLALCAPALGAGDARRGRRRRRRGRSLSDPSRYWGCARDRGPLTRRQARAPHAARHRRQRLDRGIPERSADARGRTAGCARAAGRDRDRGAGPRRRRRLLRGRRGGQPVRRRRRAAGGSCATGRCRRARQGAPPRRRARRAGGPYERAAVGDGARSPGHDARAARRRRLPRALDGHPGAGATRSPACWLARCETAGPRCPATTRRR